MTSKSIVSSFAFQYNYWWYLQVENVTISRKRFNDEAKKLKRKQHLTAPEARDVLAKKYGYLDYELMQYNLVRNGVWR